LFKICERKRGLEEGELCEESAADHAQGTLPAIPLKVAAKKSQDECRIHSEHIGFDKGYQEGKKEGEVGGFAKGAEECKQASQKELVSALAQAKRLQLKLAYESVA
jgi:flagellar biosynthesis/type III secretory pathway protein FliH